MQKFDESTVTSRDEIINGFVLSSGLSEARVIKLYEGFSFVDSSLEYIRKGFKALLSGFEFDLDAFKKAASQVVVRIAKETSDSAKKALEQEFLMFVKNTLEQVDDTTLLMEIVKYIIYITDQKNGKQLMKTLNLPTDFVGMNESKILGSDTEGPILLDMIPLNESLKYYLSHNNKRWGQNNAIEHSYNGIMDYLNKEISETQNQNSITSIDDHFHMDILNQMVKFEQVDPIYRSIDNLRKVLPDLQTFMFDLMLLVETYIREQHQTMDYINQRPILDYKNGRESLYKSISSSSRASKLLIDSSKTTNKKQFEIPAGEDSYRMGPNDKYAINYEVLDLFEYRLPMNSIFDAIHMIKAMSGEFNLNIRPVINNYVSKSTELMMRLKRVIVSKNNL